MGHEGTVWREKQAVQGASKKGRIEVNSGDIG